MPYLKNCLYCKQPFSTFEKRRKYCSKGCANLGLSNRVKRICQYCGKEFEVGQSHINVGGGKYCSRECYNLKQYVLKRYVLESIVTKICPICKKEFNVISKSKQKTCSRDCQYKSSSLTNRKNTKKIKKICPVCQKLFFVLKTNKKQKCCSPECSRQGRRKGKIIICETCKKEFYVPRCRKDARFCSKKCSGKGLSGKNNGMYGVHRYGKESPNWRKSKKIQRICLECGKEFTTLPCYIRKGGGKYCSKECAHELNRRFRHTEEAKRKISQSKIGKPRPAHVIEKLLFASKQRPTQPEKVFDELTPSLVRYIGDRTWWRKLPNGQWKNPDFKVTGQNKIIEVFGDWWHKNDDPQELINLYKTANLDCLVIWEHEIYKQPDKVIEKTIDFIAN